MSSPLRVVIAEDNYLVREGTRRLLEDSAEVDVVAAVGSADELIDAVERLRPQVVLTDIRMLEWWCFRSTPTRRMHFSSSGTARRASPTCSKNASAIWTNCYAP